MESDLKVMKKEQFFHLRFKGESNEQECSRPTNDGGTETFIAVHETLPRGGATIFYCPDLFAPGTSMIGVSLCSDVDSFSKKKGRVKAIGDLNQKFRALQASNGKPDGITDKAKARYEHIQEESGHWFFENLLTSQQAISAGLEIVNLKVHRIMERKLADLDEEKNRILDYGKKYLSGELVLKASKRKQKS